MLFYSLNSVCNLDFAFEVLKKKKSYNLFLKGNLSCIDLQSLSLECIDKCILVINVSKLVDLRVIKGKIEFKDKSVVRLRHL